MLPRQRRASRMSQAFISLDGVAQSLTKASKQGRIGRAVSTTLTEDDTHGSENTEPIGGWAPAHDLLHIFNVDKEKICSELEKRFEHSIPAAAYVGPRTMVTVNPLDNECLAQELVPQYYQLEPGADIFGVVTAKIYRKLYPTTGNRVRAHLVNEGLGPHVYSLAMETYHDLQATKMPQTIIINGDQGGGKTFSAQRIVQFFGGMAVAPTGFRESFDRCCRMMSSMGDVATEKECSTNYMNIMICKFSHSAQNKLASMRFEPAMIQTSCLGEAASSQPFRVLQQLLTGPSAEQLTGQFAFEDPFDQTLRSEFLPAEVEEGKEGWVHLLPVLSHLEKAGAFEVVEFVQLLGGLVHLRSLVFSGDSAVDVELSAEDKNKMGAASKLLGVGKEDLENILCRKLQLFGKEETWVNLKQSEASSMSALLVRRLYGLLFQHVVVYCNQMMRAAVEDKALGEKSEDFEVYPDLSIVDMWSFREPLKCQLSELWINYVAEQCHSLFLQERVNGSLQFCFEELSITECPVDTYVGSDNSKVLELYHMKPGGIFTVLQEQSALPLPTAQKCIELIQKQHKISKVITNISPIKGRESFRVAHFKETVKYTISTSLDQNADDTPSKMLELLRSSSNRLVAHLCTEFGPTKSETAENGDEEASGQAAASVARRAARRGPTQTLLKKFGTEFDDISIFKESTKARPAASGNDNMRFLYCFSANGRGAVREIDVLRLQRLFEVYGVIDFINFSQASGFAHICSYENFGRDFVAMAPRAIQDALTFPNRETRDGCEEYIKTLWDILPEEAKAQFGGKESAHFAKYGRTSVFLRNDIFLALENICMESKQELLRVLVALQAFVRMRFQRALYKRQLAMIYVLSRTFVRFKFRAKFLKCRTAVLWMQATSRMRRKRRHHRELKKSAIRFQKLWKWLVILRNAKRIRREENCKRHVKRFVVAWYIGYRCRQEHPSEVAFLSKKRNEIQRTSVASTLISRQFRGVSAWRAYRRHRRALLQMQRHIRGHQGRRACARLLRCLRTLKNAARYRKLRTLFHAMRKAVRFLQKWFRLRIRDRFGYLLILRATRVLQKFVLHYRESVLKQRVLARLDKRHKMEETRLQLVRELRSLASSNSQPVHETCGVVDIDLSDPNASSAEPFSWISDVNSVTAHMAKKMHSSTSMWDGSSEASSALSQVAVSSHTTLALSVDGEVFAFGPGASVGDSMREYADGMQAPMHSLQSILRCKVLHVACGEEHCAVLTINYEMLSWGNGERGQLGHGAFMSTNVPRTIPALEASQTAVRQVCCNCYGTAALSFDGEVYTWGAGEILGLGVFVGEGNSAEPNLVKILVTTRIKQLSCGGYFTVALNYNGDVYSWGRNEQGELGIALQKTKRLTPGKIQMSGVLDGTDSVVFVATGMHHGAMLSASGLVFTWGGVIFGPTTNSRKTLSVPIFNKVSFDETGNGSTGSTSASKADFRYNEVIVSLACGQKQCYAVTVSGRAYAWGRSTCVDFSGNMRSVMRQPRIIPDRSLPRRYRFSEREGRLPIRTVRTAWSSSLSVACLDLEDVAGTMEETDNSTVGDEDGKVNESASQAMARATGLSLEYLHVFTNSPERVLKDRPVREPPPPRNWWDRKANLQHSHIPLKAHKRAETKAHNRAAWYVAQEPTTALDGEVNELLGYKLDSSTDIEKVQHLPTSRKQTHYAYGAGKTTRRSEDSPAATELPTGLLLPDADAREELRKRELGSTQSVAAINPNEAMHQTSLNGKKESMPCADERLSRSAKASGRSMSQSSVRNAQESASPISKGGKTSAAASFSPTSTVVSIMEERGTNDIHAGTLPAPPTVAREDSSAQGHPPSCHQDLASFPSAPYGERERPVKPPTEPMPSLSDFLVSHEESTVGVLQPASTKKKPSSGSGSRSHNSLRAAASKRPLYSRGGISTSSGIYYARSGKSTPTRRKN